MEVAYSDVRGALGAADLPMDAAAALNPRTAFGRAIKDLRQNRTIDRIKTDSKTSVVQFQFTHRHLVRERLEFAYEATCYLDVASGLIDCPESPEIESHARVMFKHAMAHRNTSDITRMIQGLFRNHADLYSINPSKGVAYFVPEPHREFSAKMENFLQLLGGRLWRFPVPRGTPQGDRAVKQAVEDGLRSLSLELQEAVDKWSEKTRTNTMEKAVEKWQTIKHKAEAYSAYLGDRQAALIAELDEQKRRLAEIIANKAAATAPAAAPAAEDDWQSTFSFTGPAEEHAEQGEEQSELAFTG